MNFAELMINGNQQSHTATDQDMNDNENDKNGDEEVRQKSVYYG